MNDETVFVVKPQEQQPEICTVAAIPMEMHTEIPVVSKQMIMSHEMGTVVNPLGMQEEIGSETKPTEMNDDTDLGANPIGSRITTNCKVMVSLYAATMIVAVTLTAASMLTDQFRGRRDEYRYEQGCLSMWKYSPKCKGKAVNIQEYFYTCRTRTQTFNGAALYTSLCVGFMAAALLGGLIQLCFFRRYTVWFCLVCNVLCGVFGAIAMAKMVDVYKNDAKGSATPADPNQALRCRPLLEAYKYGPGFVLAVIGFALNIIAAFFLIRT